MGRLIKCRVFWFWEVDQKMIIAVELPTVLDVRYQCHFVLSSTAQTSKDGLDASPAELTL